MLQLFSIICFVLVFSSSLLAQEPSWLTKIKKVVPLKSTASDVKKLFGEPSRRFGNIEKYEVKNGILTIEYSTGECSSSLATYNIPKGTVVHADFLLYKAVNFALVNEDLRSFDKEGSSDTENETYRNLAKGIEYGAFVKRREGVSYKRSPRLLISMSIFPPEQYRYLECSPDSQ